MSLHPLFLPLACKFHEGRINVCVILVSTLDGVEERGVEERGVEGRAGRGGGTEKQQEKQGKTTLQQQLCWFP